jgi:hypothetical protein
MSVQCAELRVHMRSCLLPHLWRCLHGFACLLVSRLQLSAAARRSITPEASAWQTQRRAVYSRAGDATPHASTTSATTGASLTVGRSAPIPIMTPGVGGVQSLRPPPLPSPTTGTPSPGSAPIRGSLRRGSPPPPDDPGGVLPPGAPHARRGVSFSGGAAHSGGVGGGGGGSRSASGESVGREREPTPQEVLAEWVARAGLPTFYEQVVDEYLCTLGADKRVAYGYRVSRTLLGCTQ